MPFSSAFKSAAVAIVSLCPLSAAFFVKDGDRVVFYGDSITDQRIYTAFTEAFVLQRYPEMRVAFTNSGVSGDRVTGGAAGATDVRLRRDVLPYKPTVVTIMLGMNDGGYTAFDPELFKTYSTGYRNMVEVLRMALPDLRMTLIEPSPYDDITRPPKFPGGYNKVLIRYGEFVRDLAKREKVGSADLNSYVEKALREAYTKNPELAQTFIPDRVHPSVAADMLMAAALLKSWNAPAVVTSVEIDAQAGSIVGFQNTAVHDLRNTDGGVAWTQLDRSLPMSIDWSDAALKLAVQCSDIMTALDQEPLRVRNLGPGKYTLRIDGQAVGDFTATQLDAGINLAELSTPMSAQAKDVLMATFHHNEMHFARWRLVEFSLEKYKLEGKRAAVEALDRLEEEVVAAQRALAQPKEHQYEVIRVEKVSRHE